MLQALLAPLPLLPLLIVAFLFMDDIVSELVEEKGKSHHF